jgi:hypothetical protein
LTSSNCSARSLASCKTSVASQPLKELFWTKLNYDQVNKPIARRSWPEPASAALADDPTLLAAGGRDGDSRVLYRAVVSRDVRRVLGTVKCAPDLQGQTLPDGYNATVMRVKRAFDEEVKQRESERQHTLSLTLGQRYVIRELSVLFRACEDEDQKGQITLLEKAFAAP